MDQIESLKKAAVLYAHLSAAHEAVRAAFEKNPTLAWTDQIEEFQKTLKEIRKLPEEVFSPLSYREYPTSYHISQMEQYIAETEEILRIRREGVLPKNNDEAAYVIAIGRMEIEPEIIKDADHFYEWTNFRREVHSQVKGFLIDFCKSRGIYRDENDVCTPAGRPSNYFIVHGNPARVSVGYLERWFDKFPHTAPDSNEMEVKLGFIPVDFLQKVQDYSLLCWYLEGGFESRYRGPKIKLSKKERMRFRKSRSRPEDRGVDSVYGVTGTMKQIDSLEFQLENNVLEEILLSSDLNPKRCIIDTKKYDPRPQAMKK